MGRNEFPSAWPDMDIVVIVSERNVSEELVSSWALLPVLYHPYVNFFASITVPLEYRTPHSISREHTNLMC